MSVEYVSEMQKDLRKKLDGLSWMHNEPALFVADHFAELRRQVDLDAERLLSETTQSVKCDTEKAPKNSNVNETRLEFIRILEELEKRTGHQTKPQSPASEIYASFEQRIDAFKDWSSSLDDLEETYLQLAREILNEIERVDRRLLGDQTIIYWPHQNKSELGSLVYFGDLFLCCRDVERLTLNPKKFKLEDPRRRPKIYESSYLVPLRMSFELSKSEQVIESFLSDHFGWYFSRASKFFYVGKTKDKYSGYSAEGSNVDREFVSHQYEKERHTFLVKGDGHLSTSANVFDNYSSTQCKLHIEDHRLESLHVNLLPTPFTHLTELVLKGVHLESFDTYHLIAACTNLTRLDLETTYSKRGVKFDLNFLGALNKLETLRLTLPDMPSDFSVLKELPELKDLKLKGSSFFYAEKLAKLSKAALLQIVSPPCLNTLELSCFDIEAINREMLSKCMNLINLKLTWNRICPARVDQIGHLGFPLCYESPTRFFHGRLTTRMRLVHNDIRVLDASSFAGMRSLVELSLSGNSIADLPPGVFRDLPSLERLELDNNLIRHIKSGVFGQLDSLRRLTMDNNPIGMIEANAFAQLKNLTKLSFKGCQLKSIDSEMFNGLKRLNALRLDKNLIERIEVVAEDGRRINVAKANLSDEEKQLVKKHLFKDLTFLWEMSLNGNKLEKLDLNCFVNLRILFHQDLSSNKISELSGKVGPNLLTHLRVLDLNDNQLTTIDKKALPKTIRHLDLSKNRLKRLNEDFFVEFTKLGTVNLANNELTWSITEATFDSCRHSLEEIDLSQNESIRVTEGVFGEMPNLRQIDCDLNQNNYANLPAFATIRITQLTLEVVQALQQFCIDSSQSLKSQPAEACCLSNCSIKSLTRIPEWQSKQHTPETGHFNLNWIPNKPQMEILDFSSNLIERLDDPDLFADFNRIDTINLSHNRMSRIHRDIFRSVFNLCTIDLSGNNLSSIDMGLFRHLEKLKHLNLSSNGIAFLNLAQLFRICPCLQSLNIDDNQLDDRSTVESIDARMCCDLKELILANNHLEKMNFVRDMTHLEHLDLRCNQIRSVMSNGGENLLGRLKELTHLDLSGNQIRSLRDEMFTHLCGRLEYLDISSNPALDIQLDSVLIELI